MEHKFKVGDRVKITDDISKYKIGLIGVVECIDDSDMLYYITMNNGDIYWTNEAHIELVETGDNIANEIIKDLKKIDFHGHPDFYRLLVKMADLHSRKNHDYAGEGSPLRNFYKCREQGIEPWRGIMVRLSDKWSRLESFCRQGELEVKGESVVDTLMDNAVYSLLAILLFEENNKKSE